MIHEVPGLHLDVLSGKILFLNVIVVEIIHGITELLPGLHPHDFLSVIVVEIIQGITVLLPGLLLDATGKILVRKENPDHVVAMNTEAGVVIVSKELVLRMMIDFFLFLGRDHRLIPGGEELNMKAKRIKFWR
jgi:hypothetical protein